MLFKLVIRAVAVGWQLWISLMVGVVLFGMELVVVSLVVEGMWFVGVGWHAWISLVVDDVLFVLELMSLLMVGVRLVELELMAGAVGWWSVLGLVVMCGVLFTSVGVVGVVGWCG